MQPQQNRQARPLEDTNIDLNDYIAEETQDLSHQDFLYYERLLQLPPIELAPALRDPLPRDHLVYRPQCHHCQHLLFHGPTSPDYNNNDGETEEDISSIEAYYKDFIKNDPEPLINFDST